MASPQKENGFTPIANEILEELVKIDLLGAEFRVLFFIIRKTYGYHKTEDRISFTQFEKGTGISRQTINKTLKNLMAKGLIVKICLPGGNMGYSFIKDHDNWVVKTHLLVKGKWQTSKDVFTKTSKDVLTHKRKKEITKETSKTVVLQETTNSLIEYFKPINPMFEDIYKNTTERKALQSLIDKIGYEKVKHTLEALPEIVKKPYAPRITKPSELKRDLGKLILFFNQEKNKGQDNKYKINKVH